MKKSARQLTPRQARFALLLGYGYGLNECARRMGVTPGCLSAMAHVIAGKVCSPDQVDGRSSSRIVAVWAAMNLARLHRFIEAQRTARRADWETLPDVVTQARLGVA